VGAHCLLIKDHNRNGLAAGARLRFMDWVGNARFGVALPYNYWTERQWREAWKEIGLHPDLLISNVGLYPPPANWIFGAKTPLRSSPHKNAPQSRNRDARLNSETR